MSEILIGLALVLPSLLVTWLLSRILNRYNRTIAGIFKLLAAGFAPTFLLIFILWVWDSQIDYSSHDQMSPLVFLVYGFPLVLMNLVGNLVAAAMFNHSR
jgi:chromate transport protein ChrA